MSASEQSMKRNACRRFANLGASHTLTLSSSHKLARRTTIASLFQIF